MASRRLTLLLMLARASRSTSAAIARPHGRRAIQRRSSISIPANTRLARAKKLRTRLSILVNPRSPGAVPGRDKTAGIGFAKLAADTGVAAAAPRSRTVEGTDVI